MKMQFWHAVAIIVAYVLGKKCGKKYWIHDRGRCCDQQSHKKILYNLEGILFPENLFDIWAPPKRSSNICYRSHKAWSRSEGLTSEIELSKLGSRLIWGRRIHWWHQIPILRGPWGREGPVKRDNCWKPCLSGPCASPAVRAWMDRWMTLNSAFRLNWGQQVEWRTSAFPWAVHQDVRKVQIWSNIPLYGYEFLTRYTLVTRQKWLNFSVQDRPRVQNYFYSHKFLLIRMFLWTVTPNDAIKHSLVRTLSSKHSPVRTLP